MCLVDRYVIAAAIDVKVPAEKAFEFMADGMKQRHWALGSSDRKEVGDGVFSDTDALDGTDFYRAEVGEEQTAATFARLCEDDVDPASRGGAVAHALFDAIYAEARARGADRVYWHTQQYNGRARTLYDGVGRLTSFIVYEEELG
jgi:GNAT superfamily N-acetyltransferase